ncbi:MAG: hypothetical protein ABF289_15645 [Clostridiales bacterium]
MDALKGALYVSLKRPGATIFMSLLIFVYCYIETKIFHITMVVLMEFASNGKADVLGTVISLIQSSLESNNYTLKIISYAVGILVISIIIAFVFSGYFYIINNIIEKKKKFFGEFFEGVKKYYIKFLKTTLISIFASTLIVTFLVIATIPAIISTKAMSGDNFSILVIAIILDIISLFMLFFGFMFLRIYVLFQYPSLYFSEKGTFKIAKLSVDNYFWDVVEKFISFDIAFLLFQVVYVIVYSRINGNSFFEGTAIAVNWIFKSLFFIAFITYIFRSFKFYRQNDDIKSLKKTFNNSFNRFDDPNLNRKNYNDDYQNYYNDNYHQNNNNVSDDYNNYNNNKYNNSRKPKR